MGERVIFFDFDGTIQSTEVSEYSNVKRTSLFTEDLTSDEIIDMQHNSSNDHYDMIEDLIEKKLMINNKDEVRVFQSVIFGYYYLDKVRKEGIKVLLINVNNLRELKLKYNLKFIIVTSLASATINATLRIHDIEGIFDEVYGCDFTLSTNKGENMSKAYEKNKDLEPFLMIGDRGEDIDAGKKFNLKTIYCNYGHGVDSKGADVVIEKPEELIGAIENLL